MLLGHDIAMSSLEAQVQTLVEAFRVVGTTRMADVPITNTLLDVAAIDFEVTTDDTGAKAGYGILLTPWFMNLIWLPLDGPTVLPIGQTTVRCLGESEFEFIGACEEQFGPYEMCSLFSPMFEFADQAAACDTAREILRLLRLVPEDMPDAHSGRRAFLFGRARPPV